MKRIRTPILVVLVPFLLTATHAAEPRPPLPIYQPTVKLADIYFHHPGAKPALLYNHDVDIVKFQGTFFAAWNANEASGEDVPGQFNFLSVSDDFEHWSAPVRLFTREADAENPVETDNQWQPIFVNYHDQALFCAWCDYNARKTYIATSTDGRKWRNREVPTAPPSLAGQVVGFPTNHGLLTSRDVMLMPCSLPLAEPKCIVGHTRYAGVLRSEDGGQTWTWSEPIEALPWSKLGEKPEEFGGEPVTIWEPMLFEQADGRIGLLIRNSTAQDNPERAEKPHRMLLYAASGDQGRTWTKARSVEVDTICSRNYAVSGAGTRDSLLMVMFKMKEWNHFEVELTADGCSVRVNNSAAQSLQKPLLRKICFGGLYVAPPWPMGTPWSSDVRLKLDSITVQ